MMRTFAAFVLCLFSLGGVTPTFNGPFTGLLLYLFGNGEAIESFPKDYHQKAKAICEDPSTHIMRVKDKTLVYGYESGRVGWSLGKFWCHDDGTIEDLYDFNNAPGGVGNRQEESKSILIDLPYCVWKRWGSAPSSMGKCLTGYGYGQPYKIRVKP